MEVKYYDWLEHHEDIRGDKIAIRDLDSKQDISYRHLNRRAASLAAYLQSNGVKKGDRVALLIRNCPAFFEVQFACSKIGAICLPLNWRLTPNELSYILNDATPCALIHDHAHIVMGGFHRRVIFVRLHRLLISAVFAGLAHFQHQPDITGARKIGRAVGKNMVVYQCTRRCII